MDDLTEEEINLIKSTSYFLKHIQTKKNPEDYELYKAVKMMADLSHVIKDKNRADEVVSQYFDKDEMLQMIDDFLSRVFIEKEKRSKVKKNVKKKKTDNL